MPKISIIVPVYNVEKYLCRCVDSILNQTFTDFELILVDDGSPDNCGAICDEYAAKDSRVVVIHQENVGVSAARNAGIDWTISNSDSRWITFVDSDDWISSQYLEIMLNAALECNAVISMCEYQKVSGDDVCCSIYNTNVIRMSSESAYTQKYSAAVAAMCKLYRKELFLGIRYPIGKIAEDLFTSYKILFQTEYVAVVNIPLYYYYQSENSIMRSSWTHQKLDFIEAQESAISYFQNKRLRKAEIRQNVSYGINLASQWWCIKELESNEQLESIAKSLQKKLRKLLYMHWLELGYSFKHERYIYEAAFPNLLKLYWFFVAVNKRVRKLLEVII